MPNINYKGHTFGYKNINSYIFAQALIAIEEKGSDETVAKLKEKFAKLLQINKDNEQSRAAKEIKLLAFVLHPDKLYMNNKEVSEIYLSLMKSDINICNHIKRIQEENIEKNKDYVGGQFVTNEEILISNCVFDFSQNMLNICRPKFGAPDFDIEKNKPALHSFLSAFCSPKVTVDNSAQRQDEQERRDAEEAKRQREEAEARRVAEEAKRQREEQARKEAEAKRQREEQARREAEAKRIREEAQARKVAEEAKRQREEQARREAEAKRIREEAQARKVAEEAKRQREEQARREAEAKRIREEAQARKVAEEAKRQREEQARREAEAKRIREEAQARKIAEEAKKLREEKARKEAETIRRAKEQQIQRDKEMAMKLMEEEQKELERRQQANPNVTTQAQQPEIKKFVF